MAKSVKEKDIEKEVLDYLNSIPGCFAFKVQTTGFFDTKRRVFRKQTSKYVIKGTSDIICCFHGRFIAIEVKTPKGMAIFKKQSTPHVKNQKAFIEAIIACGGIGVIVSSLDDMKADMKEISISENPEDNGNSE